jgi:hypothetical protein
MSRLRTHKHFLGVGRAPPEHLHAPGNRGSKWLPSTMGRMFMRPTEAPLSLKRSRMLSRLLEGGGKV